MRRYMDELRLLHSIGLTVVATDATGIILFVNQTATEAFACPEQDLVGHSVFDLVVPEGADAVREMLAQVTSGGAWRGDVRVRRPDGSGFLAGLAATPVHDPEGRLLGVVLLSEDLTDVRLAEAQTRASQERLRLAHEAAGLGSWHWDMSVGTVVWDQQLEAIFGLPPGGFDGTFEAWESMLHPDDHDEVIATVQEAMAARSSYVLRNRIVRPDGTVRWTEAHGKVTTDEFGTATGTIGCLRDVTERVETEELQREATARALVLQQVATDLGRASTLDDVRRALCSGLRETAAVLGKATPLRIPEDLAEVADRYAFVDRDADLSPANARLLDTLAAQCATAAQRVELQRRTTDIAEQLQSSLAPSPLPRVPGVELAGLYAAGGDELEHVGGDWYDALVTPGDGVVLVVGDVMGRGVRAATTMIRMRAGIRGLLTVDPSPAAAMRAADDLVARDAPDQFVTAVALQLDPQTRRLALSSAGHVPVVLVGADGSVEVVREGQGPALGVVEEPERTQVDRLLPPGTLVLVVTDGVVESRDTDLEEGLTRMAEVAARIRDEPVDRVVAAVADLADPLQDDDITVVAVRVG